MPSTVANHYDEKALVSVIIPSYNAGLFIEETIDSALNQTHKNLEVILIDDGSIDNTVEIVSELMRKDDRIKLATQHHGGVSRARNMAIEIAKGDYIALLDHDDCWDQTKIEKQLTLFKRNNIGLVYSDAFHWLNGEKDIDRVFRKVKPFRGKVFGQLLENFFILCQSVVIRKSLLDQMEYVFDPEMEMCEEWDLFLRLALITDFDYIDEPLVRWRLHANNDTLLRPELKIVDMNSIINKLVMLHPAIAHEYKHQIGGYRKNIKHYRAVLSWKNDRRYEAFKGFISLSKYRKKNIVLAIMALFFNYKAYIAMRYGINF